MATSPASYTCDYMGYVRRVGIAARRSKNLLLLRWLEHTKFSFHVKWINCPHALIHVFNFFLQKLKVTMKIHPESLKLIGTLAEQNANITEQTVLFDG